MPIMCRLALILTNVSTNAIRVVANDAKRKKYNSGILSIVMLLLIKMYSNIAWMNSGILRCDKLDNMIESTLPSERSKKKNETGIKTVMMAIWTKIRYFWCVLK